MPKFEIGSAVRIRKDAHPYSGRRAKVYEFDGKNYGIKLVGIAFSNPHLKYYVEEELEPAGLRRTYA